jgi:hypothetical protein
LITDTLYTARFAANDTIVRADGGVLTCPIYRAGALVAPTASGSTCTVYNPSNLEVASGSVTVTGSIATYTLASGDVSDQQFGDGWVIGWDLVIAGKTHRFRNAASLVYRQLYPVVTDADLFAVESSLNPTQPSGQQPITRSADFQGKLDEAWKQIHERIQMRGRRPWLSMEPSAFRAVHRNLALGLIFEDLSSRNNGAWAEKAARYMKAYERAWTDLQWTETSTDGFPNHRRQSAGGGGFWLGGRQ